MAPGLTVIGAGTRHLPPSQIHARASADVRDSCFGEGWVSEEQMLTVERGLRTTATAAVGPQCWPCEVSVCDLRYWQPAKVHKAAELYRIVPADSLPRRLSLLLLGLCDLLSPLSRRIESAMVLMAMGLAVEPLVYLASTVQMSTKYTARFL